MIDRERVVKLHQIVFQQHQIMLDVLRAYQASRWPWVRWVANAMHEEIMYRCAIAEKV